MANDKIKKNVKEAKKVMTVDEMKLEISKKQRELTDAKRGLMLGELANPRVITQTRREIARLHTAISAFKASPVSEKQSLSSEKEKK